MALAKIAEHSDFQIIFSITKDGSAYDLNNVVRWTFAMGKDIDGYPLVLKDNYGTTTSGDFNIDTGNGLVTVRVLSTEYSSLNFGATSGGDGTYNIALYALDNSGYQFSHDQQKLQIFKQLVPTGSP